MDNPISELVNKTVELREECIRQMGIPKADREQTAMLLLVVIADMMARDLAAMRMQLDTLMTMAQTRDPP